MTDPMPDFMPPATAIIAIVQARMGSTRLPGKVLLELGGEPMLAQVVERTRRSRLVQQVVVATTSQAEDDPIADLCAQRGYPCWRGNLHDVLDRYYQAAHHFRAEVVVRITADCPVIDPELIDRTILAFFGQVQPQDTLLQAEPAEKTAAGLGPRRPACWPGAPFDFAANRLPPPWGRTYPIGLDTEVVSFAALERAWLEADQPYHREHVLPYLYEHRERFNILLVHHTEDLGRLRWTVDTPEDYQLLQRIFTAFGNNAFSWLDVLKLTQEHPEWQALNAHVRHKRYDEVDARSLQPNEGQPK